MNSIYHTKCLQLILAISRALDQLEAGDTAAAEEILRAAWQEAAGEMPKLPLNQGPLL